MPIKSFGRIDGFNITNSSFKAILNLEKDVSKMAGFHYRLELDKYWKVNEGLGILNFNFELEIDNRGIINLDGYCYVMSPFQKRVLQLLKEKKNKHFKEAILRFCYDYSKKMAIKNGIKQTFPNVEEIIRILIGS